MLGPGNHLLYGDNATVMRDMMGVQSVDLIYLDPPFKSDRNYNLIYSTLTGLPVPEQAEAFCDTWQINTDKAQLLERLPQLMRAANVDTVYLNFWMTWVQALHGAQMQLLAYLYYMVERLLWMKPILKNTGSIYLHCDPTASHYIKVMMDGIFGHQNFRNEIVWKRTFAHGSAKGWGSVHDTILFYSKSDKFTWNRVRQAHDESYVDDKYRYTDERGRYRQVVLTGPGLVKEGPSSQEWHGYNPSAINRHWAVPKRALEALKSEGVSIPTELHAQLDLLYKYGFIRFGKKRGGSGEQGAPEFKLYLEKGQPIQDVVIDISPVNSQAKERLGYPTQKPIPLLKRIIEASSDKGDVIFDPFCGCGTTIYAAQETGRQWVGCDIAILAVKLIREIAAERYRLAEGVDFRVHGIPNSVESARDLFERDAFQFQHWAVERVGGFPMLKKVADRGVDGRIYYETGGGGLRSMILSVKGGKTKPEHVRDLIGTIQSQPDADLGGFICLQDSQSAQLKEAAASAGTFIYRDVNYPRVQMLTIRDILERKMEFRSPTKIGSRISTGQANLAYD